MNSLKRFYSWPFVWVALAVFMGYYFSEIERSGEPKRNHQPIYWDAISYYAYLPATFIHGDLSMSFTKSGDYEAYFWPEATPSGGLISKTTMGIAYLYAPFFFAAHAYAQFTDYAADGFSQPYQLAIQLSGLFYGLLGLLLMGVVLRRYFGAAVVACTLVCFALGTNLFNYMTHEAAMSHAFNFFAIALFVWLTEYWHQKPSAWRSFGLGLCLGLITLIRPTNLLVVLVPLLYGYGGPHFKARWQAIRQHPQWLVYLAFGAFLVGFPQLLYWKAYAGQWLYFSYTGERFFWSKPMWIDFLFSYRKGWLLYSPLIILALTGLFMQHQVNRHYRLPSLILLPILIYMLSCWWAWWFGGGFGSRPMVDWYPLLMMPFAVLLQWAFRRFWPSLLLLLLLPAVVDLSLAQQFQYKHGILHFDSMSKQAYWAIFYNKPVPADFEDLIMPPDYTLNLQGGREKLERIFD